MMPRTRMCDLPQELVVEIFKRVPITSLKEVRSTCKTWNAITKNWVVWGKATSQYQFLTMNAKIYSLRIHVGEDLVVDVSVKQLDCLNELEISKVYNCDGMVLCISKDNSKMVVWNPYLCQTRWIGPRVENFNIMDRFAMGYDDSRNHKILRFVDYYTLEPERKHVVGYEIYEIRSNSWRVLEVVKNPEWSIAVDQRQRGVSVKGNIYFFAQHKIQGLVLRGGLVTYVQKVFLLCFDFTIERFGPRLPLPFDSFDGFNGDIVTLSSFLRDDDEQLAVLFGGYDSGFFEIWVTLTVEPNRASWSKFLRVETGLFTGFKLYSSSSGGSFFVDEENKVAVLFELDETKTAHTAFLFGQDGYFKSSVNLGEALILEHLRKAARPPLVCSSSYRPSLVQLNQPLLHKRKRDLLTDQVSN